MNTEIIDRSEAILLFRQHCEVVLNNKSLQIFGYDYPLKSFIELLYLNEYETFEAIVQKWAADTGLHIK